MLYVAITSIVFVQIFRIADGESSVDPCLAGNHENITSMGFRHVTNRDCTLNRVTDYRLVRAWYYAGPDPILTSPPDQLCRCGANFPIWMNGTLPDPKDGIVSRDTCLKYSTNCDTRFDIQVKNCGIFYVYKLPPTHEDHTAYCFGYEDIDLTSTASAPTPDSSDPCLAGNHENITSMGFRHVTNKDCTLNRVTDYRLVRAWYYAGPDPILTSPPDHLCRCGANFPIWMNGSLPDPKDGIVSLDTCLKYSTNCDTRFGIQVKNCGTFYVYKLPPTHEDHTAYCFGQDHVDVTSTTQAPTPDSSDPCLAGNHENITSMGFRLVTNNDCTMNRVTDYRLVRAWYYAGPDPILTSPPDQLCRCGANFPIWMNGTLPDPKDGIVSRDTCLKYSTNCDTHFGIQVKNCGTFYVYKLPPTHEDHTAYCFGSVPNAISTISPDCGDPNNRNNLDSGVVLGEFRLIEYNSTGVDSHATVYCFKGYGIVDGDATDESFLLTCTSGLKWNSTRTCNILPGCGDPKESSNHDASVKLGYFHNITYTSSSTDAHATVYCSQGYGVQDDGNKHDDSFQLTCKDHKWHSTRTCRVFETAAMVG